ncbi:MAG: ubiquinol-cytochrome c reductase iron-sulfur subunit [Alphaproteobacteria bacterium]|nr:ubiquinol-cytochrome c reductase iron-sulfur subunit [Alphaproteobacteria bacterium]
MATSNKTASLGGHGEAVTRRDFLYVATAATGAVGAVAAAWPLINNMNPAADTLALASIEVPLKGIEVGQSVTVKWRGKPVFIRRRTADEISKAQAADKADMPDPETDAQRVQKGHEEWLILVGVCTHLGCVPQGQQVGSDRGEYGGWFCPCHGSQYDTSGRIRKGPAPKNLVVPEYTFEPNDIVKIG